ncbi:MAG: type VI secretion system protein TssA [Luteimonas sp.]|nr:type VI secretion system protein TssA [Luteimonas sp.]
MPDLDDLLAPLPGADPCGEDLAFSAEYDRLQEARRNDDPTLDQGEWVTDLKIADWPAVEAGTAELLRTRTKDLQLAVWSAEAGARLHGFRGLAAGYRLVAGLCDRYWDTLHPVPDGGDQEQRIGNLGWLLSHSPDWIRDIPLAAGPQGRFGQVHFDTARARQANPDEHAAAVDGLPQLEVMEAARRATPREFCMALLESVPDCEAALRDLERVVDARLGVDGPSFAAVRDQLAHSHRLVVRYARDAGVLLDGNEAVTEAGAEAGDAGLDAGGTAAPAVAGGGQNAQIASRREALAQLRRVAEFFRRTEPHSPVAYLADKAARWGEMPLHVWLKRVIKDDSTLAQVEELLDVDQERHDA